MVRLDGEESHGIPIRKNSPNKKQIQVITMDPTRRTPKNHGKMKVLKPQYRGYNVIPGDSAAVTQLDPLIRWRSPFPTFDFGSRELTIPKRSQNLLQKYTPEFTNMTTEKQPFEEFWRCISY